MICEQRYLKMLKRLPPPPPAVSYAIRSRGMQWRWESLDGTLHGAWKSTQGQAIRALTSLDAKARYTVVRS